MPAAVGSAAVTVPLALDSESCAAASLDHHNHHRLDRMVQLKVVLELFMLFVKQCLVLWSSDSPFFLFQISYSGIPQAPEARLVGLVPHSQTVAISEAEATSWSGKVSGIMLGSDCTSMQ